MVSNLAMVVALAGAQPVCDGQSMCPPDQVDVPAESEQAGADKPSAPEDHSESEQGSDTNVIVVEGEIGPPQGDPAEALNAATYQVVQAVDEAVVAPVAEAYDKGIPKPIRSGLRNFLRNLGEPINFLNFLLQFKPKSALRSAGRFAINTTVGIGGLFDPATRKFDIEHRSNGLANTLGFYGVGPGPYLYLPFIGATTVRDLAGQIVDLSVIPTIAGKPFNKPLYAIPIGALNSLESRIIIDDQINAIRDRCGDPSGATRDIYLIQRQLEIDALRDKVSDDLDELVDRLEFNCDIDILTAGGITPDDTGDFVTQNTSLLGNDVASEEDPENAETGQTAPELPVEPASSVPEGPAIRYVPGEVVQSLEPSRESGHSSTDRLNLQEASRISH